MADKQVADGPHEHTTVAIDRNGKRHLRRLRKDAGWSNPDKREIFLAHLMVTCNVEWSADKLRLKTWGAYKWRARDPEFRARWSAAIDEGKEHLWGLVLAEAIRTMKPLPAPADGGEAPPIDTGLAISVLKMHQAGVARPGGSKPRVTAPLSADELRAIIFEKLQDKRRELTRDV